MSSVTFEFQTKHKPFPPKGDPNCKVFIVRNPINTKFDDFKSWINKRVKINGRNYTVMNVERKLADEVLKGDEIRLWVK